MCSQYFGPDFELDVRPSNMDNANSPEYLHKILTQVIENIRRTQFAPSVQMTDVPRDSLLPGMNDEDDDAMDDEDADQNPDARYTQRFMDSKVAKDNEFYDESEDEDTNANMGIRAQPGSSKRRRNITDYPNPHAIDDDFDSRLGTPVGARSRSPNGDASARETKNASPALGARSATRASSRAAGSAANGAAAAGARSNGTSSRNRTPAVAAVEDEDVDMEEPSVLQREDSLSQHSSPSAQDPNPAPQTANDAASTTTQLATVRASSASGSPGFAVTPPASPPPAQVAATSSSSTVPAATETSDVEMKDEDEDEPTEDLKVQVSDPAKSHDEGVAEREAEDMKAEKATEVVAAQGSVS
jgi:histone deacetylase 1/2